MENPEDRIKRETEEHFFTHLSDEEAIRTAVDHKVNKAAEAERIVRTWRRIATDLGDAGPIAVKVRAGFSLREHAPLLGLYGLKMRDWEFRNDEPTQYALVYYVHRLVIGSPGASRDEMLEILAGFRQDYSLPSHHLSRLGSAAILAGLILSRQSITQEAYPVDRFRIRTDTDRTDGVCVHLCNLLPGRGYHYCRLDICGCCYMPDDRCSNIGCFPLGIEVLA